MVNEVFDVSAEFDTCRQVIVESGVTRPYLDLIIGKSVPNPHTPQASRSPLRRGVVVRQPRRTKERSKPGEYNNCKAQHRRSGRRCSRQQLQQECSMATWEGTFLNGRYRIYLVAGRF